MIHFSIVRNLALLLFVSLLMSCGHTIIPHMMVSDPSVKPEDLGTLEFEGRWGGAILSIDGVKAESSRRFSETPAGTDIDRYFIAPGRHTIEVGEIYTPSNRVEFDAVKGMRYVLAFEWGRSIRIVQKGKTELYFYSRYPFVMENREGAPLLERNHHGEWTGGWIVNPIKPPVYEFFPTITGKDTAPVLHLYDGAVRPESEVAILALEKIGFNKISGGTDTFTVHCPVFEAYYEYKLHLVPGKYTIDVSSYSGLRGLRVREDAVLEFTARAGHTYRFLSGDEDEESKLLKLSGYTTLVKTWFTKLVEIQPRP